MDGEQEALTDSECAAGCTVSVAASLLLTGDEPLQVAVTVSVTVRLLSVVFAAAV